MWEGAIMVAVSCVLYVNMGLHEAVVDVLNIDLRITGCPRCLTFWSTLAWNLIGGYGLVPSIFVAFSLSYFALWASLLLDYLATLYNKTYEKLYNQSDAEESTSATDNTAEADDSALPQM